MNKQQQRCDVCDVCVSVQIHETIESINQLKIQRDFMLSFSRDPKGYIQDWLKSQSRDFKVAHFFSYLSSLHVSRQTSCGCWMKVENKKQKNSLMKIKETKGVGGSFNSDDLSLADILIGLMGIHLLYSINNYNYYLAINAQTKSPNPAGVPSRLQFGSFWDELSGEQAARSLPAADFIDYFVN